ncbi:uncharacterized protein LOC100538559 isoform X4 [Meleagris gallopavo]|uniref:Uncharacterized protein n=1 Tax=Meleagris gallopavo TaxID=9103 RepID=A0A803Y5R0_MELGA|nr:uncharacterized protein LOC100538559 isoform X4 [Meleagris gallopavo]
MEEMREYPNFLGTERSRREGPSHGACITFQLTMAAVFTVLLITAVAFAELHNETQRQLPPLGWPLTGRRRASMGMDEPLTFISPVPGARRWSLCIPGGLGAHLLPLQRAQELGLHQTRTAKPEEELLHQHLSGSRTRTRDAKGGTESKELRFQLRSAAAGGKFAPPAQIRQCRLWGCAHQSKSRAEL